MSKSSPDRDKRDATVVEPDFEWSSSLPPGLRPWIEEVIVPILVDEWLKENHQKLVALDDSKMAECELLPAVEVS